MTVHAVCLRRLVPLILVRLSACRREFSPEHVRNIGDGRTILADASGPDATGQPARTAAAAAPGVSAVFDVRVVRAAGHRLAARSARRTVRGMLTGAGMAAPGGRFTERAGPSRTTPGTPTGSGSRWRGCQGRRPGGGARRRAMRPIIAQLDQCFGGFGQPLVVAVESATAHQPRQGPFHHPAARHAP